jgi:hypothetical protein
MIVTGQRYSVFVGALPVLPSGTMQPDDLLAVVRDQIPYRLVHPSVNYVVPTEAGSVVVSAEQFVYTLVPATGLAVLAIVLPPSPIDEQVFELSTTQTIDDLTVTAPASATVLGGGPFVLAANGGVSWRYRLSDTTWYRRY